MRLAVTVSHRGKARHIERAREVARRTGGRFLDRVGGLSKLFASGEVDLVYVVSVVREELRSAKEHIFVNEGLIHMKRRDGPGHPFLRAVAPPEAPPIASVVDATIGLAQDAIHVAAMLEVRVEGIEASPSIACLVENGLERFRAGNETWRAIADRISVVEGSAREHLERMADGSRSVVCFDPMFETPRQAVPGFGVFRRVAEHAPLDRDTMMQAIRVASARVILKVPHGERPPADLEACFNRRVCGRAVDYLIVEKLIAAPAWERRRLPTGAY